VISFAVVGHEQRTAAAARLAHSIGAAISWDDGTNGAEANHLNAWKLTGNTESSWAAVLEDDALPVDGFLEQAQHVLAAAPEPVVSLYLGTAKPPRWQNRIDDAIEHAARTGAHWITGPHAIHAVAVAIHTDLRDDWLGFAHDSLLPIDERISAWCVSRGHTVAYTWPSLVDHADGPTLIQHRDAIPRTEPRRAWRTGTRDLWNSKAVTL
jgi:GR25 family glycosyltransferase involved in LPS biosynthesis